MFGLMFLYKKYTSFSTNIKKQHALFTASLNTIRPGFSHSNYTVANVILAKIKPKP